MSTQSKATQDKAKRVCCPWCNAGVGEKCFNLANGRYGRVSLRIKTVHVGRIRLAKSKGL